MINSRIELIFSKPWWAWCLLVLLFWNTSCFDKVEDSSFSQVTTQDYNFGNELGTIELIGQVDEIGKNAVSAYGFIWSDNLDSLKIYKGHILNVNVIPGQIQFHDTIKNLELNRLYYFLAYARFENPEFGIREVYGEPLPFRFGIELIIPDSVIARNDTATLSVQVLGLNDNITAKRYGFVYSSLHNLPDLQSGDSIIDLGVLTEDKSFDQIDIPQLDFNTIYYYRAWAETSDTIYYSDQTGKMITRDGWRKIYTFQSPLLDATAVSGPERAFIMGGCDDLTSCSSGNNSQKTWTIDTLNKVKMLANYTTTAGRRNGIAFMVPSYLCFGLGQGMDTDTSEYNFFSDFYRMNLNNEQWQVFTDISSIIKERAGAVTFTIGQDVYFGAGRGQGNRFYADFYQYQEGDTLKQMKDLPVRLSPDDPMEHNYGRADAVSFVLNGAGYVIGGRFSFRDLKDVWKFTPPDGQDTMGKWEFIGFFPGPARYDAVAFAINSKGYICTGSNESEGRLKDVWEFNPIDNTFTEVTAFPGGRRDRGFGFSLNGKGYFGAGKADNEIIHNDLWEYVPRK